MEEDRIRMLEEKVSLLEQVICNDLTIIKNYEKIVEVKDLQIDILLKELSK